MTSKDFCVWLRGYLEALGDVGVELEIERIKKKLDGVVEEYVPVVYPYYPPVTSPECPTWYQYPLTCSSKEITSANK